MQKLYQKNELWFALGWIVFYVVGVSFADQLSRTLGIEKIVTLPLLLAMCALLLLWMKGNDLFQTFGLCKGTVPPSRVLYYVPLAILISTNLWFGLRWNLPPHETLLYIASMICVGFMEEVIFRGLLFNAMRKDGLKSAVIVSSLTFGIGHIVNLFNGSGAELVAKWTADYLRNRKLLSGDFRADPRLDALDRIINENQFSQTVVLVTDVEFTYNGAFRGSYEGRADV